MKVLLVNGSPNKKGCTFTALSEIAATLKEEGIESEIYQVGWGVMPCRACGACAKLGKCVINDAVNEFVDLLAGCDGLIIGSPVHYASASGGITAFMDRAFYSGFMGGRGDVFRLKPAAAVASARRSGTTATLDQLQKYFTISEMPIISGRYWNMVHGHTPEEVKQDLEGMQNMRFVARNMAYYLKCKQAGAEKGILPPQPEPITFTNFIR